jgi:hypothetical protein
MVYSYSRFWVEVHRLLRVFSQPGWHRNLRAHTERLACDRQCERRQLAHRACEQRPHQRSETSFPRCSSHDARRRGVRRLVRRSERSDPLNTSVEYSLGKSRHEGRTFSFQKSSERHALQPMYRFSWERVFRRRYPTCGGSRWPNTCCLVGHSRRSKYANLVSNNPLLVASGR